MNFFGVEISDEQFESAINRARLNLNIGYASYVDECIMESLGFDAGDVGEAAPPAGVISRE